jgi:hypothetical protein
MDHNYYKISDVYRNRILRENMGITNDTKNSYQTTASMQGPGNGPVVGSQGGLSQGGDNVMFPNNEELSNSQKASLLIKFFKMEIDDGSWEDNTKNIFKELLDHLLGFEESDEDKTEEELMKAAREAS